MARPNQPNTKATRSAWADKYRDADPAAPLFEPLEARRLFSANPLEGLDPADAPAVSTVSTVISVLGQTSDLDTTPSLGQADSVGADPDAALDAWQAVLPAKSALDLGASVSFLATVQVDDPSLGATPEVNEAPVLTGSNPVLDGITEDDVNNVGITVADLLGRLGPNGVTDGDGDPIGIAISVNNGNGATWQFRLSGESAWSDVGTVSNAASLLLSGQDSVRLLPNTVEGSPANLGFRAWDQSSGTAGSYVSVTPTGGSSAFSSGVRSAQIAVSDVNDAPTVALTNIVSSLSEDASTTSRTKVADIVVTDDALGTETLSLSGTDAALFEVDGNELFLVAGAAMDFEANASLNVTVQVDDTSVGANPDDTASLVITVTETNDAPAVALINTVTSLTEDATTSSRTKVADIVVIDDALGDETLSLAGTDAALFEIDGTELFLVAGAALDFETNPTLDVTVQVDDTSVGTTPDDTADLVISVTDANESPAVALTNIVTTLSESATTTSRTKVADIVVTDDALGAEALSISGTDAALFEIDGTELFLVAGAALDFEVNPALNVTVQVNDVTVGFTPDDTANLSIAVVDVNESPQIVNNRIDLGGGQSFALTADNLLATDPDNTPEQLIFTVDASAAGRFELAATPGLAVTSFTQEQINNGDVRLVQLTPTTAPSYTITVSDGALSDGPLRAEVDFIPSALPTEPTDLVELLSLDIESDPLTLINRNLPVLPPRVAFGFLVDPPAPTTPVNATPRPTTAAVPTPRPKVEIRFADQAARPEPENAPQAVSEPTSTPRLAAEPRAQDASAPQQASDSEQAQRPPDGQPIDETHGEAELLDALEENQEDLPAERSLTAEAQGAAMVTGALTAGSLAWLFRRPSSRRAKQVNLSPYTQGGARRRWYRRGA